ncbi:MAG TPA: hypothetical protein VE779_02080 [Candidatus Angelobacter sp.]|jgi:hypothetical protein|nr:hypothetical protein [Candidatus Angelobacter sp.]
MAARREGTEAFHGKSALHAEESKAEINSAPETSTLSDYNSAYENVKGLIPLPVDKTTLMEIAVSIALPLLPAVIAEIPFQTVVEDLLQALK